MGSFRGLFFGDLGNWLDSSDNARRISSVRGRVRRSRSTDRRQDAQIEQLEEENAELRAALACVDELLVSKGVLAQEEVEALMAGEEDGT